jgi:curved DNA-binding protein
MNKSAEIQTSPKIKDYYKILGVDRTASTLQIKRRYKELARLYHPDANPEVDANVMRERFEEVTEAYKVLGTLSNRLKYSVLLHNNKSVSDRVALYDYEHRQRVGG